MPKLTDEDIEDIEKTLTKTWSLNSMEAGRYRDKMRNNSYKWLTELVAEVKELREKVADPTPVQPDTPKPGDKVRHTTFKTYGIGNVTELSKSGKRALVEWPNYEKGKHAWEPGPSYYLLGKLEVIK